MSILNGKFIVIEGTDGAGTTLQTESLLAWMNDHGVLAINTHEPTHHLHVGKLIRSYLRKEIDAPCWETMALLFAADRVDHCRSVIEPALRRGVTVISDRYYLSSYIYQSLTGDDGVSPHTRLGWIQSINSAALVPDHTIILTVSPAVARSRRRRRSDKQELFETDELQERICRAYHEPQRWINSTERFTIIDGEPCAEAISVTIRSVLGAL